MKISCYNSIKPAFESNLVSHSDTGYLGFTPRSQNFAFGVLLLSAQSARYPDSFHSVRPQIRSSSPSKCSPFKVAALKFSLTPSAYCENLFGHSCDVISFGAKKYDSDSIVHPANHCAYCGCKVYNERQIDALAKEMLNLKADRLNGKIKSVLEKLEDAKHSQEIAIAKRLENQQEIEFFKNFLDTASKKSFLKGEAIFEQIYHINREQANELLVKNMRPIQKTIDHVSPQNEEKGNNNSDVNLVEACYCCNHDLKKGSSFSEFYTMFPSIKHNMPKEKFEYAVSNLLDYAPNQISKRLSAANMLKFIERLFIQRDETSNYLDSINFRIRDCKTGINDAIQSCREEISEKKLEIDELQKEYEALKQDSEYAALIDRVKIKTQLENENNALVSLRERRQKASNLINDIRNPKQTKKYAEQINNKGNEEKINSLKQSLDLLQEQINSKEEKVNKLQIQLKELDIKFPSVETLQAQKKSAELICAAHNSLGQLQKLMEQKQVQLVQLTKEELSLINQMADIEPLPSSGEEFNLNTYTDEQKSLFERYKELTEALSYIKEHPNGGNIKILINMAAKLQIESELVSMQNEQIITDFNNFSLLKDLQVRLDKIKEEKSDCQNSINEMEKECTKYRADTISMSLNEAQIQIKQLSNDIRRITNKQNYIELPKKILSLKAEIVLLNQTINDLEAKREKIDSSY